MTPRQKFYVQWFVVNSIGAVLLVLLIAELVKSGILR